MYRPYPSDAVLLGFHPDLLCKVMKHFFSFFVDFVPQMADSEVKILFQLFTNNMSKHVPFKTIQNLRIRTPESNGGTIFYLISK